MKLKNLLAAILLAFAGVASAQTAPDWYYFRPDNTGVAGDYHDMIVPDKFGNIWTNGYMIFWEQGSVCRFNDTTWTDWGSYDGYLASARVTGIAFNKKGHLWVSSEQGISMYNGQTWTKHTSANTPLPANHTIMGLAVDKNDKLWVTFGNINAYTYGYASFDGTTWSVTMGSASTFLPLNNNFRGVDGIAVDSNNNKWIPSSQGLIRINAAGAWSFVNAAQGRSGDWAAHVEVDPITNRVYCSSDAGLDYFNGTSWTNVLTWPSSFDAHNFGVRGNRIIIGEGAQYGARTSTNGGATWTTHTLTGAVDGACVDTSGRFWAVGIGYVSRLDANGWKKYTRMNTGLAEYMPNEDFFVDKKNRKWFANGNGGIQVFDCPNWQSYGPLNEGHFPSLQSLSTLGTSITEDNQGNIWMTYDGSLGYAIKIAGGNYNNPSAFTLYSSSNVAPNFQLIQEVEATTNGKVFFRTSQNDIFIYDLATNTWTSMNNPTGQNPSPTCMTPGPNGTMYVGGFEKIEVWNNGTWSVIDMSTLGTGLFDVNDIAFDATGAMWVGTEAGLWKRSGTTWTSYTKASHNIAADYVATVECGGGKVYIGAFNITNAPYYGGISIFDGTTWTSQLQPGTGLPHKQVEDLQLDTLGNLWIVAQTEGIAVYKQGGVVGFDCIDRSLDTVVGGGTNPTAVSGFGSNTFALATVPNPFSEQTTLSFSLPSQESIQVAVFDMQGRKVKDVFNGLLSAGPQRLTIDRKGLASGMYFCVFRSSIGTAKAKLIVQ